MDTGQSVMSKTPIGVIYRKRGENYRKVGMAGHFCTLCSIYNFVSIFKRNNTGCYSFKELFIPYQPNLNLE